MRKNWFKLGLDIIMGLSLFSLFSIASVGLVFHEILGLALFGAMLLHLTLNWRWIVVFTKRLFAKTTRLKVRFGYILNVLLFLCFVAIILTGLTMSKVVMAGITEESETFKNLHYFASAFALTLMGVHLGLHWEFIKGMSRKLITIPTAMVKPLSAVALIGVLGLGVWGLSTSSYASWLAIPILGEPAKETESTEGRGYGKYRDLENSESEEHVEGEEPLGTRGYRGGLGVSFDLGKAAVAVTEVGSIVILIGSATVLIERLLRNKPSIRKAV
jgi:hypothetical protein